MYIRSAADPYKPESVAGRARAKRWRMFANAFPDVRDMRVLDLGGMPESWLMGPVRPAQLVSINLRPQDRPSESWIRTVEGDACNLPLAIRRERFDLVYCSSVIEHVGGHFQRQRLAAVIHESADRHWVQVPYQYFPVEPHWVFPGLQWLPVAAKAWVSRHWDAGRYSARQNPSHSVHISLSVELLSITEMRYYFPNSVLLRERMFGLVKSLVAVKDGCID